MLVVVLQSLLAFESNSTVEGVLGYGLIWLSQAKQCLKGRKYHLIPAVSRVEFNLCQITLLLCFCLSAIDSFKNYTDLFLVGMGCFTSFCFLMLIFKTFKGKNIHTLLHKKYGFVNIYLYSNLTY